MGYLNQNGLNSQLWVYSFGLWLRINRWIKRKLEFSQIFKIKLLGREVEINFEEEEFLGGLLAKLVTIQGVMRYNKYH